MHVRRTPHLIGRFRTWKRDVRIRYCPTPFCRRLKDADAAAVGRDSLCRSLLGLIVAEYLTIREVADVQSELRFVADNCDPDTDFMFMRP